MPERKPICAWTCCALLCVVPVGGILALFGAIAGVVYLMDGFDKLIVAFDDMGANMNKLDIDVYVAYVGYVVIIADAFVALYGLREKARTRLNMFGHFENPFSCLIKFSIKTVIHIVVCGSLVVSTILMFLLEAIYVLFLAIDASCEAGKDSVEDIVEIFSNNAGTVDEICDAMSTGKKGAEAAFIGSLIISVAQVIGIAYWYKYSTLAMVPAFYTTGKYSKEHETKAERKKREQKEQEEAEESDEEAPNASSVDDESRGTSVDRTPMKV